jgi:hypothetical protein
MATRFYLPATLAAPVAPPAPSGADWGHINSVARQALTTPDSSTLATVAYTADAGDHLTAVNAHHRQYVTDALEAQTIAAQTFSAQLQSYELHANNNLFLTMKVYVVSNDGSTAKETLLAITQNGIEVVGPNTVRNNSFSATLTAATLEAGDRIVIEIGLGGTPGPAAGGTQGHNGQMRWGCDASSGDLPVDDTTTGTTYRGWVQFADTLTFQAGGAAGPLMGGKLIRGGALLSGRLIR